MHKLIAVHILCHWCKFILIETSLSFHSSLYLFKAVPDQQLLCGLVEMNVYYKVTDQVFETR